MKYIQRKSSEIHTEKEHWNKAKGKGAMHIACVGDRGRQTDRERQK